MNITAYSVATAWIWTSLLIAIMCTVQQNRKTPLFWRSKSAHFIWFLYIEDNRANRTSDNQSDSGERCL